MKDSNRYLSQKVREARGNRSLRQFSEKCGVSHAYLQKLEQGVSHRGLPICITLQTLDKLVQGGAEIDYEQLMAIIRQENQ